MLMAPFLILFVGVGIYYFLSLVSKKYKIIAVIFISLIYMMQLLNFANIYLLRNPIYNSESFNFSTRVLSKYVTLYHGKEIFVINGDPKSPFKSYLFYGNFYNHKSALPVSNMYKNKKYVINNIHFSNCEGISDFGKDSPIVYESGSKCSKISHVLPSVAITHLSDGGAIYAIFNDTICSKYKLSRYPYGIQISDIDVEKLSEKKFCEKFIIHF